MRLRIGRRDGLWLMLALSVGQCLVTGYLMYMLHTDWYQSRASFLQVNAGWQRHLDAYLGVEATCQAIPTQVRNVFWEAGLLPLDGSPDVFDESLAETE